MCSGSPTGRLCLWPILLLSLTAAPARQVVLAADGPGTTYSICEAPPDPSVSFPMYNRLMTIRLPLRRDPATIEWATAMTKAGSDALTAAGLHELRHLLVTVFPGKLWIHDAATSWLEENGALLVLKDVLVELNSPADADHCSNEFQQHLFMAAETHAADTRFDMRQFSDVRVEYSYLFGACKPGLEETVHFYGALRLDKSDLACRNLPSAAAAALAAPRLGDELRAMMDHLFFLPSSQFNVTGGGGGAALPLFLQSNSRVLAFAIDYRMRVSSSPAAWSRLNAEITGRYAQLARHPDDYGVQRQGVAPSCLNYLNFLSPPVAVLAASCKTCYDLTVPVAVNISLSESADIRPPQCESIAIVAVDATRHAIETRGILSALAAGNITSHLFLPASVGDYFTVHSVSCSATPKRLVAELEVRLRALQPALLRYPQVLRAGLQRNLNAYLVARHLGLASLRLTGEVSARGVDCGSSGKPGGGISGGGTSESVGNCEAGTSTGSSLVLRHSFRLSLSRQSSLLAAQMSQLGGGMSPNPDALTGLVRFLHTAAMARALPPGSWLRPAAAASADAGPDSLALRPQITDSSAGAAVVVDAEVAYSSGVPAALNVAQLRGKFVQAVAELQADLGPMEVLASNFSLGNCTPRVDEEIIVDDAHALRLRFGVSADLLYGGRIGDYLLAAALNAALRRAGMTDIDSIYLTERNCAVGDTCQVTATIHCNSSSHQSGSGGGVHLHLATLTAALTGDPLLRPINLHPEVESLPSAGAAPRPTVYRFNASSFFSRPATPPTGGPVSSVRLTFLWRLASLNASAPLAFRRLPLPDGAALASGVTSEARLRFLLEQLVTDILGARLVSWPAALAYRSDGTRGRLDVAVALTADATPVTEAPGQLSGFLQLSDLRARPVRPVSTVYSSALLQQSYFIHYFLSNATLQATSAADLQRLLAPKMQIVQAAIFSGQPGRPSLTGFEFRATNLLNVIRVDAVTSIVWRSAEAAFDEASLTRLVNTELEALRANLIIFPMQFETRRSGLHMLDSQNGLDSPYWCNLLLKVRPVMADVAAATSSWLPVSERLTAALGAATSGSHVSVLNVPTDLTAGIDALVTVLRAGGGFTAANNCSAAAARLMESPAGRGLLISTRPVTEGIFSMLLASSDPVPTPGAISVRHSALLPYHHHSDVETAGSAEYFCFLVGWAHLLFGDAGGSGGAACVTATAEALRVRMDPLADPGETVPTLRLSATSAFLRAPPANLMSRFWSFKNFYLASNETFVDLDMLQLQDLSAQALSLLITKQLPDPPPHTIVTRFSQAATLAPVTTSAPLIKTSVRLTTTSARPMTTSAPLMPTTRTPIGIATTAPVTSRPATISKGQTAAPQTPPTLPPGGGHYKRADRAVTLTVNFDLPTDPWQSRYFLHTAGAEWDIANYIVSSALMQSLQRSAWQLAPDEVAINRVWTSVETHSVGASLTLLLTEDHSADELQSVLRSGFDQSVILSTAFPRRSFTATVASLPATRYLYRPPVPASQPGAAPPPAAVTVEHRMLVQLSADAPEFLRIRAPSADGGDGQLRDDVLLEFFLAQLVTDAYGDERLSGRPALVQYKSDNRQAMIRMRYDLRNLQVNNSTQQLLAGQFAAAWLRLPLAASLRQLLHLEARPGPLTGPHRGLLIYQLLRLESYVSKKSLMSLPSDYLGLLLRPKIEYVMRQVYSGGSSVPLFLDVDSGFTKKDGGLEILALTRVSIAPGYRLSKLEQRLQHHVMQRLEELANDINLVPSVFSAARTDVRVLDLKEGLSLPNWCDVIYSFGFNRVAGTPPGGVELSTYLIGLLAPQLPPNVRLERLAVLSSESALAAAATSLDVRALVTLSSAQSMQFEEAVGLLMKAATALPQLHTRAITSPYRGQQTVSNLSPGFGRARQLTQSLTIVGGDALGPAGDLTQMAKEKLVNYACHLYQSALDTAHWYGLHLLPHTCSAATATADTAVRTVSLTVSRQPQLSLAGVQVNITATVVGQNAESSATDDLAAVSDKALISALAVKNFYLNAGELVLTDRALRLTPGTPTDLGPTTSYIVGTNVTKPPGGPATVGPIGPVNPGEVGLATYTVLLDFAITKLTWDYLIDSDAPMTRALAQFLLRDALSTSGYATLSQQLVVTNISRVDVHYNSSGGVKWTSSTVNVTGQNITGLGNTDIWFNENGTVGSFGRVLARAPMSAATVAIAVARLRTAIADAVTAWPLARSFFTGRPLVHAWKEGSLQPLPPPKPQTLASTPATESAKKPSGAESADQASKGRHTRSTTIDSEAMLIEHRMQVSAVPYVPVYFRYQDIPLRPDPLLSYLAEHLLRAAMRSWSATNGVSGVGSSGDAWPKLMWLRSDNSTVTLCIRYPATPGQTDVQLMDGFLNAWVDANRLVADCSLCLARNQEVRRMRLADHLNQTVALLVYQRIQFDSFVGKDTMRKLDHDDLNQLMRHRLHFILTKLYPGGNLPRLAGFDFECYGRNSSIVTFMLVRLLAGAPLTEAALHDRVIKQLADLATDSHVLPAELSTRGADLRLLAVRDGLPAGTANWFDLQATFQYPSDPASTAAVSLQGHALAAAAQKHLERLLTPRSHLNIIRLRLLRWKRLPPMSQLATVLVTLATDVANAEAAPQELRSVLANATGLAVGPNLTLPLQDFHHEPAHYDRQHLDLLHSGVAVRQAAFLVDSGDFSDPELTSDYLCLLLASAFRQRGEARLRLVDDSCAAQVSLTAAPAGQFRPHPLSTRLIPSVSATAYYTLHNSTLPFDPAEAADAVDQMMYSLNAYADIAGRTMAAGSVTQVEPTPVYQALRFKSADFPGDLRNASSQLYRDSRDAVLKPLSLYLRRASHLYAGQVSRVAFDRGSVVVLVDYLVYPRLLDVESAARSLEVHTEALFAAESPFHGLQLDRDASLVSLQPIATGRQPILDMTASQAVPVAIYCILGVACFLLLVLSALLLARLIRMRRNNRGIRPAHLTTTHSAALEEGRNRKYVDNHAGGGTNTNTSVNSGGGGCGGGGSGGGESERPLIVRQPDVTVVSVGRLPSTVIRRGGSVSVGGGSVQELREQLPQEQDQEQQQVNQQLHQQLHQQRPEEELRPIPAPPPNERPSSRRPSTAVVDASAGNISAADNISVASSNFPVAATGAAAQGSNKATFPG